MAVLASSFYPDPAPALIFTGVVVAVCIAVCVWVAVREFGLPGRRPTQSSEPPPQS